MKASIESENGILQNNTLLLIIPQDDHLTLLKVIGPISKKKICFVTLSKTYDAVEKEMDGAGVDRKNLYILDCVTSSFSHMKAPEHVVFVPSPDALTDLNISIIETLKNEKCDYMIFDSISTLLTYKDDPIVARFTDFIIGKVKELKSKAIFTCSENDAKRQAVLEISLHVDKVINASEFNGKK